MEPKTFSGIIQTPYVIEIVEPKTSSEIIQTPYVIENDKIMTWTQPKEGEITLNNTFFNWDLLKELKEISKNIEDSDKYKGMFKNEN